MALKKYVMVVEWHEYQSYTRGKLNFKENYTCSAGTVDEAMENAESFYMQPGRYGLLVSNIYSEDA